MRTDLFDRLLPAPTALLLLAAAFELTNAARILQPLPRRTPTPTITLPYHALDVVSFPVFPTPPPRDLFALRRRQDATVCGYIGGDTALPATCSAGSHCVIDQAHNVVGCCPDGQDTCTAGVFTGCVDANSGPQTEVNPYVFSCTGDLVCYKNVFDGGASQFGCGTASDLGTSVGVGESSSLIKPTVSVSFTQDVSTLSTPTTLGSLSSTSSSSASSSSASSSSTSSSTQSQSSTRSSSSSAPTIPPGGSAPTADPSNAVAASSGSRTGAIVGGTVGGLAVLIALVALVAFFLRRRQGNERRGPSPNSVRGKYISSPQPGPGTGFAAVPTDSDAYETGLGPSFPTATAYPAMTQTGDPSPYGYGGAGPHTSYPPSDGYHYPGQYPAAYAGAIPPGRRGSRGSREVDLEPDQVPLTREIDDFSHTFAAALGRIGEEEDEDMEYHGAAGVAGGDNVANGGNMAAGEQPAGQSQRGSRPLWQQNRRQSRNLMWM